MSTKKDFTQEEKAVGNPSQYNKGTETPEIESLSQKSQMDELATRQRYVQTNEKDLEEAQAIGIGEKCVPENLKRAKRTCEDKFEPVTSGIKDLVITLQAPEQPLPFIQTDEDSLTQQPPTSSQSNFCLGQLQSPSSPTDSSSVQQPPPPPRLTDTSLTQPPLPSSHIAASLTPPPPPSQSDSKSAIEVENVEAVRPKTSNLEESAANDSSSCDKAYQRELLCEKILNSDPLRGIEDQVYFTQFFTEFYDNFSNDLMVKTKAEFLELNNDYDRIKYVLQFEEIKNLQISTYNSKSELNATILEEEYMKLCPLPAVREIQLHKLQLINRCIQFTPGTNKRSMGIRLMKRASINFSMMKFDAAREDAYRSLEYHSDPSVMWHSFEILGHCYAMRDNCSTAKHYFNEAKDALIQSDIDNAIKAPAAKRISRGLNHLKGRKDRRCSDENYTKDLMTPGISYGINAILKCATEGVQVMVNNETGRGLYSKREIKPGDVLIVEKPYASALSRKNFETHCNYCYKRFRSPIPCDTCSRVWFCSKECLNKANADLHSLECGVLNFLYEIDIGTMGIFVFRILLRLTWENIKSLRKSQEIDTRLPDSQPLHKEFNRRENYFKDIYLTTYKLVTNSQKRSFDDLFKRTIIAVYIKQCLKAINFFTEDVSLEDETFVASLILRHLQSSSCNSHSITEFSNIDNDNIILLGGGIYPTISLINHSCNPNVFRYCVGKNSIVRATKKIGKGEQLFDSYGSLVYTQERESRREFLQKHYKFDCDCIACKENWPSNRQKEVYMRFACPEGNCDQIVEYDGEEKMNCPSCGFTRKHRNLMAEAKDKIKLYEKGLELLKHGQTDEAIVEFKHFQMYADMKIIPPSKCLRICRQKFLRCYLLQGNLFKVM